MLKAAESQSPMCMQALLCPLAAEAECLVLNDMLGQQAGYGMSDIDPTCHPSP